MYYMTHEIQYKLYLFINFFTFTNIDPLFTTICITFSQLTSLIMSFEKQYILFSMLFDASTNLRKTILLFYYNMILIMLVFVYDPSIRHT